MMKKNVKTRSVRILFAVLLIVSPAKGFSQDIRMGIFFDPLITWMSTNSTVNNSEGLRPGFNFGFTAQKYFAPNYAISTGISFVSAGGRQSCDSTYEMVSSNLKTEVSPGQEVVYKMRYISLPIGLKLQTNEIGYATYFADFGLDTKILISSKYDIPAHDIKNESGSKEIKPFNMGWHLTMGLEYSLGGTTALSAGLGIENNFFDVTKDNSNADQIDDRSLLNIFRIRLGIIF